MTKLYITNHINDLNDDKEDQKERVAAARELLANAEEAASDDLTPDKKREIIALRKQYNAEVDTLREISATHRQMKRSKSKKGTLLPLTPYRTPTLYKTRKAIQDRVRRGFDEKKQEYAKNLQTISPSLRAKYPNTSSPNIRAAAIRDYGEELDLDYEDWDTRRHPLWAMRVGHRKKRRATKKRRGKKRRGTRRR